MVVFILLRVNFFYRKKFDIIYKKIILEFLKDVIALHILYTVRADME